MNSRVRHSLGVRQSSGDRLGGPAGSPDSSEERGPSDGTISGIHQCRVSYKGVPDGQLAARRDQVEITPGS